MMLDHVATRQYLLVRPAGGLTDMLCQIERSIEYGRKYGRYIVIDTEITDFFNEPFSHYFEFSDPGIGTTHATQEILGYFNRLATRPREISGRLDTYSAEQIPRELVADISKQMNHFTNLRDRETKTPLTFNMDRPYKEPLLVHHCSGGGAHHALDALRKLSPTDALIDAIRSFLAGFPDDYSAIHIRNTDLKSDLAKVCEVLPSFHRTPVLICSDDPDIAKFLRVKFPALDLISLFDSASFVDCVSAAETLHRDNPHLPRSEVNTQAIVELVAMASASKFYAAPLVDNPIKSTSGFSELVLGLRCNPEILNRFLPASGNTGPY